MTEAEYKEKWKECSLEIKCIEVSGKCKHELGNVFTYKNPYEKPKDVCNALLHVMDLYTWRAATGFPSWDSDDRSVYRVHCPSKKGTVWELRKTN